MKQSSHNQHTINCIDCSNEWTRYLISLQYGILHISFLQSQAWSHNAENVIMSSIELGSFSFTFLFHLLLNKVSRHFSSILGCHKIYIQLHLNEGWIRLWDVWKIKSARLWFILFLTLLSYFLIKAISVCSDEVAGKDKWLNSPVVLHFFPDVI